MWIVTTTSPLMSARVFGIHTANTQNQVNDRVKITEGMVIIDLDFVDWIKIHL